MAAAEQEAIKQLADVFPDVPTATLGRVLQRHAFNTTAAVEELLNPSKPIVPSSSAGWHQMSAQKPHHGQWQGQAAAAKPSEHAAEYVGQRKAVPLIVSSESFPTLGAQSKAASAQSPALCASAAWQPQHAHQHQHQQAQQAQQSSSTAVGLRTPPGSRHSTPPRPTPNDMPATSAAALSNRPPAARLHNPRLISPTKKPAVRVLPAAVQPHNAVDGLGAVTQVPPQQQQPQHQDAQQRGMAGGQMMTSAEAVACLHACHAWASKDLIQAVLLTVDGNAATAEAILLEMEHPNAQHGTQNRTSASETSPHRKGSDLPQHTQRVEPASTSGREGAMDSSREFQDQYGDVYWQHRKDALKLTREWQKLVHRAAQAYAVGAHSEVRSLTAAARGVREQALAAHTVAANRILAANNEAKGLGLLVLDLHGLHADEAIEALSQRIQLLERQLSDATGPTQHLSVIVGRGNHSSGGEASLPRVVTNYLTGMQYRYSLKGASVDVALKRLA